MINIWSLSLKIKSHLRPVHATPKKFQNVALLPRLGLPSTQTRYENGAFRKRFSNLRNLKTSAFHFSLDGKHFKNRAFQKRLHEENHVISPPELFSNTNSKWSVIVGFQISHILLAGCGRGPTDLLLKVREGVRIEEFLKLPM